MLSTRCMLMSLSCFVHSMYVTGEQSKGVETRLIVWSVRDLCAGARVFHRNVMIHSMVEPMKREKPNSGQIARENSKINGSKLFAVKTRAAMQM